MRTVGRPKEVGPTACRVPKPYRDREWLRQEYVERQRSAGDIAKQHGIHETTIRHWLKKNNIERRTWSEARALHWRGLPGESNPMFGKRGEAAPGYVDGSSDERARLYQQFEGRRIIREVRLRDKYRCVRCGCSSKQVGEPLHVHHIAPWAGNPDLRFEPTNLITLCPPCHYWVHSKDNSGREYLVSLEEKIAQTQ